MKAKGIFMFKNLQKRDGGSFLNKETGQTVPYNACYVIVCDEIFEDGKIQERRFKFELNDNVLAGELSALEPYTKIKILFDVVLYSANAKVVPVSFELV